MQDPDTYSASLCIPTPNLRHQSSKVANSTFVILSSVLNTTAIEVWSPCHERC